MCFYHHCIVLFGASFLSGIFRRVICGRSRVFGQNLFSLAELSPYPRLRLVPVLADGLTLPIFPWPLLACWLDSRNAMALEFLRMIIVGKIQVKSLFSGHCYVNRKALIQACTWFPSSWKPFPKMALLTGRQSKQPALALTNTLKRDVFVWWCFQPKYPALVICRYR